jgi:hypothetical protein
MPDWHDSAGAVGCGEVDELQHGSGIMALRFDLMWSRAARLVEARVAAAILLFDDGSKEF